MIIRLQHFGCLPSVLGPSINGPRSQCVRALHQHMSAGRIPSPTPFVPDAQTFLSLIGRNLSQHAAKIPSWEALFSLTSKQLRELGVEPARSRRYLLRWREKFRNGEYGIGGDLKEVTDGSAEVKVTAVPTATNSGTREHGTITAAGAPAGRKVVVNVPPGAPAPILPAEEVIPVKGLRVRGAHTIVGPHVELVEGTRGMVGRIKIKAGLWEQRRGHKVDGGERRKAEVRAKRRSEERRTTRK